MKKITKISLLTIFIIFVLGITTSNAFTILQSGNTDPYTFTKNVNGDKKEYCINRNVTNWDERYAYGEAVPETITGARAYMLYVINNNPKFTDEERDQLNWHFLNQGNFFDNHDLIHMANQYEEAMKNNKDVSISEEANSKTFSSEDKILYGPIKIDYYYLSASKGDLSDSWGGFVYAFFDKNNNNISNKVKLYTFENNTYKEIVSNQITDNDNSLKGYYKVSVGDYSNVNLYIGSTDKTISKVYMRLRSTKTEYFANVKTQEYRANLEEKTYYCDTCKANGEINKVLVSTSTATGTTSSSSYSFYNKEIVQKLDGSESSSSVGIGKRTGSHTETTTNGNHSTIGPDGNGRFSCSKCGQSWNGSNAPACRMTKTIYEWSYTVTTYKEQRGCGKALTDGKGNSAECGHPRPGGEYASQPRQYIESIAVKETYGKEINVEFEFGTSIEIDKTWLDYDNNFNLRPNTLHFNVYRSTDNINWTLLTENTDYNVTVNSKTEKNWEILISGLLKVDNSGREYKFKVEEKETQYYKPIYPNGNLAQATDSNTLYKLSITNELKKINIGGYVWLDGQTGIKPAIPANGIMDNTESKMKDIPVYLFRDYKHPSGQELLKTTLTDENGHYEFKDVEIGWYYIVFQYDGINYINELYYDGGNYINKLHPEYGTSGNKGYYINPSNPDKAVSMGYEIEESRRIFNSRFETITYKKSNDGTVLNYIYENGKSILNTKKDNSNQIAPEFTMDSATPSLMLLVDTDNINLGLQKRGVDIAASTDVYDAQVSINGQLTNYTYNRDDNNVLIGNDETEGKVQYNLNLYASDYKYRIRDYVSNAEFKEKDYINADNSQKLSSGSELDVNVIYKLNLQNQSIETVKINQVKYMYDSKYIFERFVDGNYNTQNSGNILTIDLNGLQLAEGETKTIYLIFRVAKADKSLLLGDFFNSTEITSYSTDDGLIDVDSQPGNYIENNENEDDSDTANGIKISVVESEREIAGKVFSKTGENVNDVIVQLIELKTVQGKTYEYIWQETVSGSGKGIRINGAGTELEEYTYTKENGQYKFIGFIPGDYIVRFIYGDGTTYDLTGSAIKYNGQDYKSMPDSNYKAEWYNKLAYSNGASVARDNEARRLETMAYSVNMDASKGVLLKLLNNVTPDRLNLTEKEVIVETYNKLYDPDITSVTTEVINKLLKEEVLRNTWMCAETSKIKISVDTENNEITASSNVNGLGTMRVQKIDNINLGLELRPATQIELKKYITAFKLTASNGQTIVNAYIDVNEYLNGEKNISNKVQGIKDYVTILQTVWQYEVAPTEINTIVDGANLEYEYTLVVKNSGEDDYLSKELANKYNSSTTAEYVTYLTNKSKEVKAYVKNDTYRSQIGSVLGNSYYLGGKGAAKVLTEVTNIRDYVNNDLTFITSGGNVEIDTDAPTKHRILRDDWTIQDTEIKTILRTTETTGKMDNTNNNIMYKITLGKNPISSTGNLEFENYIAEVMSYTNAAGRRSMTSTPGNAEIVDQEHRTGKTHEIDEADTAKIQMGVATGEDQMTNYIIIIGVALGLIIVAVGAYVIRKHILK